MNAFLTRPTSLHSQLTLTLLGAASAGVLATLLSSWLVSLRVLSFPPWAITGSFALLTLTVFVWTARWVARQMLAPIEHINHAIRQVTPEVNAFPSLPSPNVTELKQLSSALEALFQKIVSANAAHESLVAERIQRLASSETRLNLVLTANAEGYWDWNLRSNTVLVNAKCCQLLSLPEDSLSHASEVFLERVAAADRQATLAAVQQCLKNDAPCRGELLLTRPDQSAIWVLIQGTVVERDAHGRATRMVGSVIDITVQRKAQDALKGRTEQLNSVLDVSPDGFVALDQALRVKYVSHAFTRLTGLETSALLGLDEAALWRCLEQYCMAKISANQPHGRLPLPHRYEHQTLHIANPQHCVLDVSRHVSVSAGSAFSQILCFRDITQGTVLDRQKDAFMATVAHELRTPLSSIYGFAELFLARDLDEASRQEFAEIMFRQARTMSLLLDDLLDLARLESLGEKGLVRNSVSAQALVKQVVTDFKIPAGRSTPIIKSPEHELVLQVDSKKARQALLNVLSNAYKYSPNGGDIHIAISAIHADDGRPMVEVEIADQGVGMTPEHCAHIYERFYRAKSAGNIPGTGLGMAIVKEIMDQHGGGVSVTSVAHQGTRVCLQWPSESAAEPAES